MPDQSGRTSSPEKRPSRPEGTDPQEWRCDQCGAVVSLPTTLTDNQAEAVLRSHVANCGLHCGPECESAGQEHPRLPGGIYLTESCKGYRVLVTDGFGWWKDCTDEVIGHSLVRYWAVGDLVHTVDHDPLGKGFSPLSESARTSSGEDT